MKRASYRYAVRWIAANDDDGCTGDLEVAAGLISVVLIADLFDVEVERVAEDVVRAKRKQDRLEGR